MLSAFLFSIFTLEQYQNLHKRISNLQSEFKKSYFGILIPIGLKDQAKSLNSQNGYRWNQFAQRNHLTHQSEA